MRGDRVPFVLTWAPSHHPAPAEVDAEHALRDTVAFWTVVGAGTPLTGRYAQPVNGR